MGIDPARAAGASISGATDASVLGMHWPLRCDRRGVVAHRDAESQFLQDLQPVTDIDSYWPGAMLCSDAHTWLQLHHAVLRGAAAAERCLRLPMLQPTSGLLVSFLLLASCRAYMRRTDMSLGSWNTRRSVGCAVCACVCCWAGVVWNVHGWVGGGGGCVVTIAVLSPLLCCHHCI